MKGKNKKKQIAKISVFITSIFVILFSVTYAFITQVISGTKQVVVTAGVLDLVLEEENSITIENALPMYDEVGMIQAPFTFRLVNNGSNPANYKLKLVDVTAQTVERKCSDLGEITLDSPAGCRRTIYTNESRQETLAICRDRYSWYGDINTEQDCLEAYIADGASFKTFEEIIDDLSNWGNIEDTRTIVEIYPDNVVEISVWELEHGLLRYGLTKNGENTIGSIGDMEYTWKIDDPELRTRALEVCKNWYPEVTDEYSCLEALKSDGGQYKTFDDFVGQQLWPNGGRRFTLDTGKIGANETINYDLRLWISEYVEYIEDIEGMTFSFKIDIEVSQEITIVEPKRVDELVSNGVYLGENCKIYDDGVDTFLVGQCSNNYVWYSGKLWRVVLKNNETGAVKMITDNAITSIPYNEEGNTVFENSYMDQWLNQEFLPTLHEYEDYLVVDSIWDATENSSEYPSRPLYTTQLSRAVGTLNSYEYYTTYNNSDDLAIDENGYLINGTNWWLMTPNSSTDVRYVRSLGYLSSNAPTAGNGIRPAVNLKSTIKISGGSGIQSDPYILEGDIKEAVNGVTLLSTRYSGEYITFNNELYRIVDIEDGLTKITAVDKPDSLNINKFDVGSIDFANASIKTDLENYYQGLKTTNEIAYNMIEPGTTWYLGTVDYMTNYHYKASICASVEVNTSMNSCTNKAISTTVSIGLPRIGEMFTSQITRGTKEYFWTLTPYSSYGVLHSAADGTIFGEYPSYYFGARPSMYLKQNVVIASDNTGNGTYEHPYSIELGQ